MPSTPDFLAQVLKGEAVRKAAHEAEVLRQRFSLHGVDMPAFVPLTDLEVQAEAQRRADSWNSAEAALKRELIAAAERGMEGACKVLAAADRGDEGWADQARKLFAAHVRKAA